MVLDLQQSISEQKAWTLTNVDFCPVASVCGQRFLKAAFPLFRPGDNEDEIKVGNNGKIVSLTCCASAIPPSTIAAQSRIHLASLVGSATSNPTKYSIIGYILQHMRSGSRLVIRSAAGLKELVYEPIASGVVEELCNEFRAELEGEIHPVGEVLNSVIVIRKS